MKTNMITEDILTKRHLDLVADFEKSISSNYGSSPIRMFKPSGDFNIENWNGGEGVIRKFTSEFEIPVHGYCKEYELGEESGDIVVSSSWFNDQNYYQITLRHCFDEFSDWGFTQYLVTYYKSRGKTEMILKDGKPINISEYVHLLNVIEASGFKLDLIA